ncbi:hypothetical protein [Geofilum rubicundum]|uniref:hypothetical protein n=1 Tax=Geofilum rubicundum TaxID=472113 RepID=UPI001D0E92EC|nr:hypothetical protein [Geofilum rubicundum]
MDLFDVYPLMNVSPVKAEDCYVWDDKGVKYLDLYGGMRSSASAILIRTTFGASVSS